MSNLPALTETEISTLEKIAVRGMRSKFLPKYIQNEDQAFYIMLRAQALGVSPIAALDHIYPTQSNKLAMSNPLAMSIIAKNGGRYEVMESSETICRIRGIRDGWPDMNVECSWEEDIVRAGLHKDKAHTYGKYQRDMLFHYTFRRLAQRMFGDMLLGMTTVENYEEAQLYGSEKPKVDRAIDVVKQIAHAEPHTEEAHSLPSYSKEPHERLASYSPAFDFKEKQHKAILSKVCDDLCLSSPFKKRFATDIVDRLTVARIPSDYASVHKAMQSMLPELQAIQDDENYAADLALIEEASDV